MYSAAEEKQYFDLSKKFIENPADVLQIEILRTLIKYHEWKYYVQNNPVLADFEYDLLFKQLQKIESKHPEMITSDSPTQRVSDDITTEFGQVAHIVPMLSLENSYNEDDLRDFDDQIRKLCMVPENEDIMYAMEPKFDGGSIALLYENDYLVRAATRGNGTMGEEITLNAKAIPSIPLKAEFSKLGMTIVELRGEALIRKDVFKQINAIREEEELTLYANPRNAATGGLRTKDPKETRKRGLEAFIFQMGYATDKYGKDTLHSINSHYKSMELLGELGFKIPIGGKKLCKGISEVIAFCNEWQEKRDTYEYEIDGMVVKVDDFSMQERCGSTGHHPRWAIAFKFKAKQATTKMINIEYQVGKVGSITPVAKLNPVQLAGVTVSSVSLHNAEFIRSKDLRIGDTVLVERAGDVIPYIVKSMEELRDGSEIEVKFPENCPINDTDKIVKLEQGDGESAWRCPNCVCGAQDLQRIIYHVSKDAMDIDGFGKSYVERFYELGWIKDIADVYHLNFEAISILEGFGDKSAHKLKTSIEKARHNPLNKILHSLSIHHLGKKASKLIAEQIEHIMDLRSWPKEKYTEIKDIGPVVAENVSNWFSNPRNIDMLARMELYGVDMNQKEEDKPLKISEDGALFGQTILFTGTLLTMGRKQAEELAAKHGAKNISAVSSNLNILVAGEKAGSKLTKAKSLGTVKILNEEEFIELINNPKQD